MSNWSTLPYSRWDEPAAFLQMEEWRHLHLSSRIKSALEKKPLLPLRDLCLVSRDTDGEITGVCLVSPSGVLFPAFEDEYITPDDERELADRFKKQNLFSIVGTSRRVDLLTRILKKPARAINDYMMMTGPRVPQQPRDLPGVTVRMAVPGDIDRLLPLEIAYQKEEVLLSPSEAEPLFIRHNLLNQLKEQMIFLAEEGDQVIGKGGSNAIGYRYIQIGGVYTLPAFRAKGIATALVTEIIRKSLSLHKNPALFVKPENRSARELYLKLQFEDRESFKIIYYR